MKTRTESEGKKGLEYMGVWIPKELKELIRRAAQADDRSITKWLVHTLRELLQRP